MKKIVIISIIVISSIIATLLFALNNEDNMPVQTASAGVYLNERTMGTKENIKYEDNFYKECFAVANVIKNGFEEGKLNDANKEYVKSFIKLSEKTSNDYINIVKASEKLDSYLKNRNEKDKEDGLTYLNEIINQTALNQ